MNTVKILLARFSLFACVLVTSCPTLAGVVNGNFESGFLSPWTTYTTANGDIGSPAVVLFDTNGDGTSSLAAQLRVGQSQFMGGVFAGGGIRQSFTSVSGELTVGADIATALSADPDFGNASGGRFRLLIDNIVVDELDFGEIDNHAVERGVLEYSGFVSAGLHELLVLVERPYQNMEGGVPFQYIDDVRVSLDAANTVAEPSSLSLFYQ